MELSTPAQQQKINKRLEDFEKRYGVKLSPELILGSLEDSAKIDPVVWGMKNRAIKGEPYRFNLPQNKRGDVRLWNRHRPFLAEMLKDQTQYKAIQKSRQAGVSENAVTEALWFLDTHPNTKAVYTFPSDQQMEDFSNTRVRPALEETPYMRRMLNIPDNVKTKQIGANCFLLMRSAQTSRLGEGIDADIVFLDEKDRMSDKIGVAFEQGLSSSSYGLLREFSTPTIAGSGINKGFEASCKYQWFVKCASGHRQHLTFEDNIEPTRGDIDMTADAVIPGSFRYRCREKNCVSELNRWDGEWIAERPELIGVRSGYQLSQLECVWISADRVMSQRTQHKFMDLFYNYVLGLPFSSTAGLISEAAIEQCFDSSRTMANIRRKEYTAVSAGIDWGTMNWCVVIGRRFDGKNEIAGIFSVADNDDVLHSARQIAQYLQAFNPEIIVADLGYGRDRDDYLTKVFPDRTFSCTYSAGGINDRIFQPVWNDSGHTVRVDRTMHLRNALELIKMRRVAMPGRIEEYSALRSHILNLVLLHEEVEDKNTREHKIVEYIGQKGPDHLAHAFAYSCLGLARLNSEGDFRYMFI